MVGSEVGEAPHLTSPPAADAPGVVVELVWNTSRYVLLLPDGGPDQKRWGSCWLADKLNLKKNFGKMEKRINEYRMTNVPAAMLDPV